MDLRWQRCSAPWGRPSRPSRWVRCKTFRERLIARDMDRRLLERTVELPKSTKEFDWKKLPKTLRMAIDSAPLEGLGRVEDTISLLAHAARKVVGCAADLLQWPPERVCREARAPLLMAANVKVALDRDWSDPAQKASALKILVVELENLKDGIAANLTQELKKPPLSDDLATLQQLMRTSSWTQWWGEEDPGGWRPTSPNRGSRLVRSAS